MGSSPGSESSKEMQRCRRSPEKTMTPKPSCDTAEIDASGKGKKCEENNEKEAGDDVIDASDDKSREESDHEITEAEIDASGEGNVSDNKCDGSKESSDKDNEGDHYITENEGDHYITENKCSNESGAD